MHQSVAFQGEQPAAEAHSVATAAVLQHRLQAEDPDQVRAVGGVEEREAAVVAAVHAVLVGTAPQRTVAVHVQGVEVVVVQPGPGCPPAGTPACAG